MQAQESPLKNWMSIFLRDVKKEIEQDHLQPSTELYQKYFRSRPKGELSWEEIFSAYEEEIARGNQKISEWVVQRWIFKHGDLYQVLIERMHTISPSLDQVGKLTEEEAKRVVEGLAERFGAVSTFLLVVLNGEVFPISIQNELLELAEEEERVSK